MSKQSNSLLEESKEITHKLDEKIESHPEKEEIEKLISELKEKLSRVADLNESSLA